MKAKLQKKIDAFLAERRESESGGWAPIGPKDMEQLSEIISLLITSKWGGDADNDRPVEYELFDRTRYQRPPFFPIPYMHQAETPEAMDSILDLETTNLSMAVDAVQLHLKQRRLRNKQK